MLKKISILSLLSVFFLSACSAKKNTTSENTLPDQLELEPSLQSDDLLRPEINISEELPTDAWQFPELSQDEKETFIRSVQIVFNDYYVHRTQKKQEYGFDSQAEANKLSSDMSSEVLLRSINKIFNEVRDLHTGFRYPVPAQCVIGGFPLEVELAYGNESQEKLIIKSKLSKTIHSKSASNIDELNFDYLRPGDEILAITNLGLEGVPSDEKFLVKDAIKELEKVSRGANADASKTRAVKMFFSRSGAYMKPPSGRFTIMVRHAFNGKIISHSFPWVIKKSTSDICANVGQTKPLHPNNINNRTVQKFNRRFEEETFKDLYNSNAIANKNISSSVIESSNGKKFIFVHINRFVPAEIDSASDANYLVAREKIIAEVNELRDFVIQNGKEAEGLIFDVRDNGGGYGVFPQLIANAFTTEFIPNMSVQPLVSQMNRDTFHNLEFSRFFKRFGTADPLVDNFNIIMTKPISETANEMDFYLNSSEYKDKEVILSPADRFDEDENDAMPPEYDATFKKVDTPESKPNQYTIKEIFTDKPIAVLTNSNCYSSCDIFVSIMKDYQIAKIIGENAHTGGGGANVVEWANFTKSVVLDDQGTPGPIIPNGKALPQGAAIRFAWNRIVRVNALDQNNERYIEGNGVLISQENVYKPNVKDVVSNDSVILEKIMKDMTTNTATYPIHR